MVSALLSTAEAQTCIFGTGFYASIVDRKGRNGEEKDMFVKKNCNAIGKLYILVRIDIAA